MADNKSSISAKILGGGSYYRAQQLQSPGVGETPSIGSIPQSLDTGASDEGIAKLYSAFINIGKYKDQIYKSLVEIEEYSLVQTVLDIMHDDVLSPDEATGECFTLSSKNKKYDSIIKGMESRLELENSMNALTGDL